MAFSKIEITFNRLVEVGENIFFNWRDLDINGGTDTFITNEVCRDPRLSPGQFSYDGELNGKLQDANYFTAWDYDYNGGSLFKLTLGADKVTIEAKKDNIEFFSPSTSAGVTFVITNEPQVPTFYISSITYEEAAADKCTNVKVRVACTDTPTALVNPVVAFTIEGNDVLFDYVRGTNILAIVTNGVTSPSQSFTTPAYLEEPTVNVVNTPTGATATISGQNTLTTEYSIDGVNYQSSNTFPGLAEGNFTAYVRDTYGCVKSTAFAVDGFTPDVTVQVPYSYVSTTNSIRFKKDELWDNNTIFKNDGNTLSTEERADLRVPFIHKFTDQDVVPIQFKTNYETQVVTLINCTTQTEDNLVSLVRTDNLNKVDVRDALGYEFEDGIRYGFYFQTGNVYDDNYPVNSIKDTYELFGSLPAWAKIGNYFSVDFGAYVQIVDIVFVEALNSQVMVCSSSFAGNPINVILKANYNVFNWNAYEFDIDMVGYLNQEFQIKIELTDSNFEAVTFISEKVQVYSDLTDRIHVKSFNTENNDVVYQTGIKHIARIDYDIDGLADESELELHKTDDNVYSLNGYSYDKKAITFTRLSTMIARQVRQMLTLDTIFINGVKSAIEEIATPARIGTTNMYKLEVTYYEVSEKPSTGDVNIDVELDIVDVPALIIGDNEFVKQ